MADEDDALGGRGGLGGEAEQKAKGYQAQAGSGVAPLLSRRRAGGNQRARSSRGPLTRSNSAPA